MESKNWCRDDAMKLTERSKLQSKFVFFLLMLTACLVLITPVMASEGNWVLAATQPGSDQFIESLITYDDGTGEAIFATSGMYKQFLKYNTTSGGWVLVAPGVDNIVMLAPYNDGTGEAIFGVNTYGLLYKYNSISGEWIQITETDFDTYAYTLATYNDGTGEALYAGDYFGHIYKYNSTSGGWIHEAAIVNPDQPSDEASIFKLITYDDGTGKALYAATGSPAMLFKYNSTSGGWIEVADVNSESNIYSLVPYDDGTGEALYGGTGNNGLLIKFDSTAEDGWVQVAAKFNNVNLINSLITYNDGTGEAIFGISSETNLLKYNSTSGGWIEAAGIYSGQSSTDHDNRMVKYFDGESIGLYAGTRENAYLVKYEHTQIDIPITANFTSDDPLMGLGPLTVNFIDTSIGADYWHWDFGDGTSSYEKNPSHTYIMGETDGNFNVTLTVANAAGYDVKTVINCVTLFHTGAPPPVASFSANPLCGSYPLTVTFTDSSINATSWHWDFGDGTSSTIQNPTHEYNSVGEYDVTLTATNLYGQDIAIKSNYIEIINSSWVLAAAKPENKALTTSIVKYNDGTGEALFGGFEGGTNGYFYKYNFTSGGWIKVSENRGLFQLLATYDDGTGETIFGDYSGRTYKYNSTSGEWIQFAGTDLYTTFDVTALAYKRYNDGTGEALFAGSGDGRLFKYNSTSGGWILVADRLNEQWRIFDLVTYDDGTGEALFGTTGFNAQLFKYNSTSGGWIQVANQATYQNNSKLDTSLFSSITYDDGTGEAIFAGGYQQRLYKYNSTSGGWIQVAGKYPDSYKGQIAKLIIYDDGTGEALFAGTHIGQLLKYDPTSDSGWIQVAATYNGEMSNRGGGPGLVKYFDGNRVTIYLGRQSSGNLIKYEHPLINNPITANFSPDVPLIGTAPFTVNFIDTSIGDYEYWHWDFGDGTSSHEQNPSHTYFLEGNSGNYNVTLIVANTAGHDVKTVINCVRVIPDIPPIASFTGNPTTGMIPLTVTFTDTSYYDPTSWHWDFGDGTSSTIQNPTHEYNSVGEFNVTLTAINSFGQDNATYPLYIKTLKAPEISFTGYPTSGKIPLTVTFTGNSTHAATSWHWDFGDGTSSTIQNPSHEYVSAGDHDVTLTAIIDGYGEAFRKKVNFISVYTDSTKMWGFSPEEFTKTESGLITLNATQITEHSVVLNGISPGPDIPVFCALGTSSNHYSYIFGTQQATGFFNESIEGMPLFPGKTYYYRVGSESGAYGEEKSFVVEEMDDKMFPESTYGQYAEDFIETDGDFLEMIMIVWEPYEDMWTEVLFFGILLSMTFISIAWRQQSVIVTVTLYTLIGWPLASMFPPEFYKIGAIMCCIAVGGFIYWVFTKSR